MGDTRSGRESGISSGRGLPAGTDDLSGIRPSAHPGRLRPEMVCRRGRFQGFLGTGCWGRSTECLPVCLYPPVPWVTQNQLHGASSARESSVRRLGETHPCDELRPVCPIRLQRIEVRRACIHIPLQGQQGTSREQQTLPARNAAPQREFQQSFTHLHLMLLVPPEAFYVIGVLGAQKALRELIGPADPGEWGYESNHESAFLTMIRCGSGQRGPRTRVPVWGRCAGRGSGVRVYGRHLL